MSSVINVRLNEKMTLKFVELYRDQRLLWDKEHEAYNKRTDRLRAYRRIADGMAVEGLGVPEVASKIKNIRSTYLQELKKIKEHKRPQPNDNNGDEDSASSGYVPKLLWFPIMDSMIGDAAVERLYPSPSTAEILSIDYANEEVSESSYFDNSYCEVSTGGGDVGGGIKRKSPDDVPPAISLHYGLQQSSSELFGRYIASSLDSLSPRMALQAQKDLHDVLIKYRLMECDQKPSFNPEQFQ